MVSIFSSLAIKATRFTAGVLLSISLLSSALSETDPKLVLKHDYIILPSGEIKLSLSFFTDNKHNYLVEARDDLAEDSCRDWLPLPNAPHNYGIIFTTNNGPARLFRLRRIDEPQTNIYALLSNDTGFSSRDGVTSDPSASGLARQFPSDTVLEASLDSLNFKTRCN